MADTPNREEESAPKPQKAPKGILKGLWDIVRRTVPAGAIIGGITTGLAALSPAISCKVGEFLLLKGIGYHCALALNMGRDLIISSAFAGVTPGHLALGWLPGAIAGAKAGLLVAAAVVPAYVAYKVGQKIYHKIKGTTFVKELTPEVQHKRLAKQQRQLAEQHVHLARQQRGIMERLETQNEQYKGLSSLTQKTHELAESLGIKLNETKKTHKLVESIGAKLDQTQKTLSGFPEMVRNEVQKAFSKQPDLGFTTA